MKMVRGLYVTDTSSFFFTKFLSICFQDHILTLQWENKPLTETTQYKIEVYTNDEICLVSMQMLFSYFLPLLWLYNPLQMHTTLFFYINNYSSTTMTKMYILSRQRNVDERGRLVLTIKYHSWSFWSSFSRDATKDLENWSICCYWTLNNNWKRRMNNPKSAILNWIFFCFLFIGQQY